MGYEPMTHLPKSKRRENGTWGPKKGSKDERSWWMGRMSKKKARLLAQEK